MLFNHKPTEKHHQLEYIHSENNDTYYSTIVPSHSTYNSMTYRIKHDYKGILSIYLNNQCH
jgi:hypothetical protein